MPSELIYLFGHYRLHTAQRMLLAADQPVRLGGRALDLLTVLVERAARVVAKDELTEVVWPRLVVEENNLNRAPCCAGIRPCARRLNGATIS